MRKLLHKDREKSAVCVADASIPPLLTAGNEENFRTWLFHRRLHLTLHWKRCIQPRTTHNPIGRDNGFQEAACVV